MNGCKHVFEPIKTVDKSIDQKNPYFKIVKKIDVEEFHVFRAIHSKCKFCSEKRVVVEIDGDHVLDLAEERNKMIEENEKKTKLIGKLTSILVEQDKEIVARDRVLYDVERNRNTDWI